MTTSTQEKLLANSSPNENIS